MLILNFTYPLRCLRVPPVEYYWSKLWIYPAAVYEHPEQSAVQNLGCRPEEEEEENVK
jgi:hypothetical protein